MKEPLTPVGQTRTRLLLEVWLPILLLVALVSFRIGYGKAVDDAVPICGQAIMEVADEGVKKCKEAMQSIRSLYP